MATHSFLWLASNVSDKNTLLNHFEQTASQKLTPTFHDLHLTFAEHWWNHSSIGKHRFHTHQELPHLLALGLPAEIKEIAHFAVENAMPDY